MKRTIFLCLLAALTLTGSARRSLRVGVAEVGNSGAVQAPRVYINALTMAGHTAIVIPDIDDPQRLRKILEDVDALVLPGGEDVEPARYGAQPSPRLGTVNPRRDDFEFRLLKEATRMKKPILGICRGMQMINVFLGGTLYQDLPSEYPDTSLTHRQEVSADVPTHQDILERGSRLHRLLGLDTIAVNSCHHQAVKQLGRGLRISARATDGVIEGIECDSLPIAAVQFHPERLATSGNETFQTIFRELKRLCKR